MKHIVIDARESGTTSGRYVDKLIEYLHKLNIDYHFTLLAKPKRVEFLKRIAPTFTVKQCDVEEFTFAEQLKLLKQIKGLQPDLVHFPFVQQPVLYRGKVVTTMQDFTTIRFRNPTKNWLVFSFKREVYKWVNKYCAKKSVQLITPTEFVKQDVVDYCHVDPKKITVTLESADVIPDKPEMLPLLQGKQFIMYIGRPLPHKNLPRLVAAFKQLQKRHPDLFLVLAGKKDTLYQKIEAEVHEQDISHVIFTGFVSEGQLKWLYQNTAVYVFPSLSEGFGLPALEAMKNAAVPVASSNATCLPEVYQDAAYYFNPLDIDDMAEKIDRLLSNKEMADTYAKRGSELVKKYSWQRMAEKTLDVYKKSLED